jgi:hypothetical protein
VLSDPHAVSNAAASAAPQCLRNLNIDHPTLAPDRDYCGGRLTARVGFYAVAFAAASQMLHSETGGAPPVHCATLSCGCVILDAI